MQPANATLLRLVEWQLKIPHHGQFTDKPIASKPFSIEYDGCTTFWELNFNFRKFYVKQQYSNMCSIVLCLRKRGIIDKENSSFLESDFTLKYTGALRRQAVETTVTRHVKRGGWETVSYQGEYSYHSSHHPGDDASLFTHTQLMSEYKRSNQDACIDLKVAIYLNKIVKTKLPALDIIPVPEPLPAGKKFKCESSSLFEETVATSPDIVLNTADGTQLKSYQNILAEKSPVFKAMFTHEMFKKLNGAIDIVDFSGAAMKELLRFMSIGVVNDFESIAKELYEVAKAYQVTSLLMLCYEQIRNQLDVSNVLEMAAFADLHGLEEFFHECCQLIEQHFAQLKLTEEWSDLNPKVQSKILMTLLENSWVSSRTVNVNVVNTIKVEVEYLTQP